MRGLSRAMAALLLSACASAANVIPTPSTNGEEEQGKPPILLRAEDARRLLAADPPDPEELFAPSFLAQIPPAQLRGILDSLMLQVGACVSVEVEEVKGTQGTFRLRFERGNVAPMNLMVEDAPPHRILGLWIGPPAAPTSSLDEVSAELRRLPGAVSFLVLPLGEGEPTPLVALEPDRSLAIGSAGKLWILAELIRAVEAGERRWEEVVALRERSLPSGLLQEWPQGAPLTLHSLAALMISRSDNTATDQLLRTLGREKVEEALVRTGHGQPERNRPFLATRELFLLKSNAEAGVRFLGLDAGGRRRLLDELRGRGVEPEAGPWSKPRHIEEIEWFASARDLASLMRWFEERDSDAGDMGRRILAINPGLATIRDRYSYVGFKGGSEPGVLNLSFLVRRKVGSALAVVATWNDPSAPLEESRLLGLVERALAHLAGG